MIIAFCSLKFSILVEGKSPFRAWDFQKSTCHETNVAIWHLFEQKLGIFLFQPNKFIENYRIFKGLHLGWKGIESNRQLMNLARQAMLIVEKHLNALGRSKTTSVMRVLEGQEHRGSFAKVFK